MKQWLFQSSVDVPNDYHLTIGGDKLISEILLRRGYDTPQKALSFLDPSLYHPTPPTNLDGIESSVTLLRNAIAKKKKILVWGDFDVDGQTSTTLLFSALKRLNANVNYYIPNRDKESHGIQLLSLQQQIENTDFSVLLTCDTGISAHDAILYAKEHGIQVIVTDHHQPSKVLPQADSIVNPRFLPHIHPLFNLSGVGVAYKLVLYYCISDYIV